jgi:putative transposase
MVSEPERYPWSSCRWRLGDKECEWLDYDECYLALGRGDEQRKARYREFLHSAIPDGEWALIREAVQRGQLTGSARFTDEVGAIVGKRIERRVQGRLKKPGIWVEK